MNDSDLRRVGKAEKALFGKICKKDDISRFITHSDEYIKRGDAIEAVQIRIKQIGYENDAHVLSICQALRDIPAADVHPVKRGEWIGENPFVMPPYNEVHYQDHRCPFCKTTARGNITTKFCEECGAELRRCKDGAT